MNEKMSKRIRRLETRVTALEGRGGPAWDSSMESAVRKIAEQEARRVSRRQVYQAELAASQWKHLTYAILVGCIIVLIIANTAVHAKADDTYPVGPPVVVTAKETAVEPTEEPEEAENELIEAALLARSHVIEDCTITFYCNEKYPHICGNGNGITADGTPALAWATCAVDPDVIPLGSTVLVDLGDGEGLRTLVANDTGVKGNHLDICVGSHSEAEKLGRKTAAVYWCEE